MMKRVSMTAWAAACLLCATSVSGYARQVSLAWDPNSEPDIAGYKIYYRTETAPTFNGTGAAQGRSPIDVGNITGRTLTELTDSDTWCFAVTAYNATGAESSLSNQICTTPIAYSPPPPVTAPETSPEPSPPPPPPVIEEPYNPPPVTEEPSEPTPAPPKGKGKNTSPSEPSEPTEPQDPSVRPLPPGQQKKK